MKTTKRSQAPGDATVLKRFFRDNFVFFRRRSKRIAFLESVSEFFYVRVYAFFNFRDNSASLVSERHRVTTFRDHFSAPFKGLYLQNAHNSHKLSRLPKGTPPESRLFYRYHWFEVKFPYAVRRIVEGYPKNAKNAVFGSGSAHAKKIPEFFTIAPVLTSTLTICHRNRGDPSFLYRT